MERKKIKINPRIIKHLGQNLITTSEVAVVELIKNSIDAKTRKVNLMIFEDGNAVKNGEDFLTPLSYSDISEMIPQKLCEEPIFIIEDIGKGMNDFQLENGFLEIGTNLKNNNDDTTLGEKGIGRLAAQRLGRCLLVETASASENFATVTLINWEEISNANNSDYFVPYKRTKKMAENYTRLWILGVNISDLLETPAQMALHFDRSTLVVNRELKSAINFLISPFSQEKPQIVIRMFYNNIELDIDFPIKMLQLSESIHKFNIKVHNNELILKYELGLKPWYIERVHRVLAKPEAFRRLKREHRFYRELLDANKDRIDSILVKEVTEQEFFDLIAKTFDGVFELGIIDKSKREEFSKQKSEECLMALKKIIPISGEIYSFKQNSIIGEGMIIESLKEIDKEKNYNLKELKEFLKNYNGVKLYRDVYRIGFLGDKENDWIKLQQYRTKGQQWYRFDLGNTVGYVSLNDPEQKNIREISSRLEINQNEVSESFKMIIGIVFNNLFYELNRKANNIIKVLLTEKGLLEDNIAKRVKKKSKEIDSYIKQSKKIMTAVQKAANDFISNTVIEGEKAIIPAMLYKDIEKVFQNVNEYFDENQIAQKRAADLLIEADEQLKAIEVESYNNYKLMANGLITETITHELHSISKTGVDRNIEEHFDFLADYFVEKRDIKVYNNRVQPVKSSYSIIAGKINDVANLYSFLENTFIKKGTYDEFIFQRIEEVVISTKENLIKVIQENDIHVIPKTDDLSWFVPKGVLIHVFYNLINNSIYWIDMRRKFADVDKSYFYADKDQIVVEAYGEDFIVYDTGTGVNKTMEDILFEPLESGKPNHQGRGMGLYIVKKLLNSFGANIELLFDRNLYGNRYKFLISLDDKEV